MVTTPDGVSVSAGDLNAQVTALQQILDSRARAVENAQQRAHQAVMQARAQQAANEQQARALQLRAASRGLRINSRPGVGVNVPFLGFVGSEGEFSVEPDPENPVFKAMQLDQQLGRTRLEGEQAENRRSALQDRIQEETALISQELQDIPKTTSPAGRAHFESEILDRFDPRSVQAFRERELQERGAKAQVESLESESTFQRARARTEESLASLADNPEQFIERFLQFTPPEELEELGVETIQELNTAVQDFVSGLREEGGTPTVGRFRDFLKQRQLRDLEIESQKVQLKDIPKKFEQADQTKANEAVTATTESSQKPRGLEALNTRIANFADKNPPGEGTGNTGSSSFSEALNVFDFRAIADGFEGAVKDIAESNNVDLEAAQKSMSSLIAPDLARAILTSDALEVFEVNGVPQVRPTNLEVNPLQALNIGEGRNRFFRAVNTTVSPIANENIEAINNLLFVMRDEMGDLLK